MDDKLLQARVYEHLSNTKWDLRAALQRFDETGVKIDRRFRRDFIKQTTDCVIDTCERYWNECKQKRSRKEEIPEKVSQVIEKKSAKKRQSSKDNTIENSFTPNNTPPMLRTHERENSPEMFKRRKTNDVVDSGVRLNICKTEVTMTESKIEQPMFFFYCTHCLDTNETNELIGGSIDDVYQHWRTSHLIHIPSKPFQFYVAEIAVCRFGDAIGTYRELLKHQQQVHTNDPLAIVSYDDRKKCGICQATTEEMVEHFEKEHKAILKKEVLNPMRLTDQKLDELLKIEIHKKRQCGHCAAIFETEDEIDTHHSIGHKNMVKISKPYTDYRSPFLICGYCHTNVGRDDYFGHIKTHPYVFRCWKCTFQTKDLVNLVVHDKYVHDRDTLDYHCSCFSNWIKTHFNDTKMVLPNGLVLQNYNLFGTKFDDSKVFQVFVDGLLELVKVKFALLIKDKTIDDEVKEDGQLTPVEAEDATASLAELNKQNELANNLIVIKMPRLTNMDLRAMFLKLCDKVKVKVSVDDIQQIHRRAREGRDTRDCREGREGRDDDTIVCLKSHELKEEIRIAAQKYAIFSGNVFELQPDQWNKQMKVISHTTPYYSDMLAIAKDARANRTIFNYELSKCGLHIKRSPTSDDRIFISKTELLNFINRS
ncbi:uncharacterized protein LOC129568536 [Sitodiplosis mosellana]|uniref:uncharacterized protein LOC129568536 n=1 Tax=Sitodiplosis mosellana TaxID=263140 RepID=UPI00244433A9|nr:uncharacterized protein LOC129568536 [Sitodiplosis mosellana]